MNDDNAFRLSVLTAGFIGGVISLALERDLTPFRAMMTVVAGTACAAYLTPIGMHYTGLKDGAEHAMAFVLGITGMNALAGFFKLSENFAQSPMNTIKLAKDKSSQRGKSSQGDNKDEKE